MWPEMLRKGRSVDEFLWKGDRKAKPIQRAALVIFSMMFLFMTVVFLILAWRFDDDWVARLTCSGMACLAGAFGVRYARNVFLR